MKLSVSILEGFEGFFNCCFVVFETGSCYETQDGFKP
jgi:hypothetical protein